MPSQGKVTRLVNLLLFLERNPGGASTRRIMDEVAGYQDASGDALERRFRRDRADLANMGFAISRSEGPDGLCVYSLDASASRQSGKPLDTKDVALLEMCAESALVDPSFAAKPELTRALCKLRVARRREQDMEGTEAHLVEGAEPQENSPTTPRELRVAVERARSERGLLMFRYSPVSGHNTIRKVIPIREFSYLGTPYLLGFDVDRMDSRRFRIDRIGGPVRIEAASPGMLAAAREHMRDPSAVLPFQIGEDSFRALIAMTHEAAGRLSWEIESSGIVLSCVDDADSGLRTTWSVEAANETALASWAIANGPGVAVIEPESASAIMRRALERAAEPGMGPSTCEEGSADGQA